MYAMADSVTRPKLYIEFMANYQDKGEYPQTLNSLIREYTKDDSRGMRSGDKRKLSQVY